MPSKLFIGGIPKHVTTEEFKEYFEKIGALSKFNLVPSNDDNNNYVNRGYGFILYAEQESEDQCLNAKEHVLGGRSVDVRISEGKRFFLGGIDEKIKEKH